LSSSLLFLAGCLGYPEKVEPVSGFEQDRYWGKWYEIARLDHSFERGLEKVTAEYAPRPGGGIRVVNRGYDPQKNRWRQATGKAFPVEDPSAGYLKVSFFGPFYGAYVIFELDKENYQYAFVSGSSTSYLWLLARTPTVSEEVKAQFVRRAKELGFATENLIWVNQD
jgi:apolipoprotein D and lipocalin family protein